MLSQRCFFNILLFNVQPDNRHLLKLMKQHGFIISAIPVS